MNLTEGKASMKGGGVEINHGFKLSEGQKTKIAREFKKGEPATITFKHDALQGPDMMKITGRTRQHLEACMRKGKGCRITFLP